MADSEDAATRCRSDDGSRREAIPRPEPADALRVSRVIHGGSAPGGAIISDVVFGTVWTTVQDIVTRHGRWSIARADPAAGFLEIEIRPWLGGRNRALHVMVSLDEVGLTRVEARWPGGAERPPGWASSRDLLRFYRDLARALDDTPRV
jgi:hypothetical protein